MRTVLDVNALRDGAVQIIRGADDRFTFYYDETNNIRKLYLTETGSNVTKHDNFVIGGIVLKEGHEIGDVTVLRNELRMQKTATEIKLKHIATGSFEEILASQKMGIVLSWMINHGIYIHYSNINILYWSVLDIVESIVADESFNAYIPLHREMKNELYRIVACDTPKFLSILKRYGYPDIAREQTRAFLSEVENFLDENNPEDTNLPTIMLKELIRKGQSLTEFMFLVDEDEGVLIDNFHAFFLQPIYVFKNSLHIFDNETEVEKILNGFHLMDGKKEVSFRFTDSKKEVGIQLSDVITGFLGKYFVFIEENSMPELLKKKDNLNATQMKNLELLRGLIDLSDEVSDAFFHRVAPMDSDWKSDTFLHGLPPAPHLL